jgi:RNA polymerase subunit RPABC4/transcription elongation factor Spt4
MKKCCSACKTFLNGEELELNNYKGLIVKIEPARANEAPRLHITDGEHHITREIFYCPFCGNSLEK